MALGFVHFWVLNCFIGLLYDFADVCYDFYLAKPDTMSGLSGMFGYC
jgi:hypothetical protein